MPVHDYSSGYVRVQAITVISFIFSYTYTVNALNQRTSVATGGEAFAQAPADWEWNYDALEQLTRANTDEYTYDRIGNRIRAKKAGQPADTYTTTSLNQYTQQSGVISRYDADGNLLSGLLPTASHPDRDTLHFTWNAENRPVSITKNNQEGETYIYDHKGRRILAGNKVTIYDGYNALAEYTTHNIPALTHTYAWGLDLSGDLQSAGGVGGLVAINDHTGQIAQTWYPLYDGNGNITQYLSGDGTLTAHYEYDAFGNVTKKTGEKDFSYQFSTRPRSRMTGLTYYNYRDYDPAAGRWISRDPMEEEGGINLYQFVGNNTVSTWDLLGLEDFTCKEENLGQISNINYTFTYFYGAVFYEIKDPEGYIKNFIWDKAKGEAMDGAGKMSKWAEKAKKGWEFSAKAAKKTTLPIEILATQTTTLANHFSNLFIEIKGECCVCRNGHYYKQDIISTASDDGLYPMFKPQLKLIDHDSMDRLVQSIVSMVGRAGDGFRDACDERVKVNFED